ncbi:hypothetical protein [Arthrobacter pigmenti]|nr:hypothetical protein [Arthrobacter pigmenti]
MELGWYIGKEADNLTKRYADLVQQITVKCDYERVILVGSSGGGFGSLAMSRRIPQSCAVAFSPQTSIAAYHPNHRKVLSAVIFPQFTSFDQIEYEFAERINLRTLYRRTKELNFFRYVQNTGDRFHFEAHYAAFALSHGVDPETGGMTESGNGHFIAEKYEKGHAPPPRARFRGHIREAHRAYFGEDLKID